MFPYLHGVLGSTAKLWTPADPTDEGGVSPHTWLAPGVENFQDAAKTTPAGLGDVVGAVVSQGTDVHDVTQPTTANKPILQQVTVNDVTSFVWRCDGTDDWLRGAFGGGAVSQPLTMFVVAKINTTSDSSVIFWGDGGVVAYKKSGVSGNWTIYAGAEREGSVYDTNWNIWTILFNSTASKFWHNGVLEASGNAGALGMSGLTVGADLNDVQPWLGDIGPILIYEGNLSNADKNQIGEWYERTTGISWTAIT